ncbi:MAG: TatD family nuclease-associated radical SAM protein [Clostridia bacterium]|nr:TatD family nuclease-associated radical SAM protein [Clostridia bacterium]
MKTFVYEFGDSLYINLTNRCSNNCEFCIRNFKDGVGDNNLRLSREPSFYDIQECLSLYDLKKYKEMVFCGFGEPMCALSVLSQVGPYLKRLGLKTRINTNGQAALINKRDDVPKIIAPYIDAVSISMNASNAELYQEICKSVFGEKAFDAMLEFAKGCVENGIDTTFSVVDFIGEEEIEKCRALATSVGAKFRVRETIHEGDDY